MKYNFLLIFIYNPVIHVNREKPMFTYLKRPISRQVEHTNFTPVISVKDEHLRMVRKVNIKNGWGGEIIATLDPEEHRVLCECVALRFIQMNDAGLFVMAPLGGSFLEQFDMNSVYTFINRENKEETIDLMGHELLMLQAAAYSEDGVKGICNLDEMNVLRILAEIGLITIRDNEDSVDYYLNKKGIDFLIDEGYILG